MKDYKKKYEDALNRARQVHTTNVDENKKSTEYIFPELKESEDERIRKQLLNWFKDCNWDAIDNETLKRDDIIAWLEKQGEQKSAWSDEDEEIYKKVKTAIDSYYAPFSKDAEEMSEWFKSLKGRVQPQPKQDWSEEDEKNLKGIIDEIEANKSNAPDYDLSTYNMFLSWLESIKERMKGE